MNRIQKLLVIVAVLVWSASCSTPPPVAKYKPGQKVVLTSGIKAVVVKRSYYTYVGELGGEGVRYWVRVGTELILVRELEIEMRKD